MVGSLANEDDVHGSVGSVMATQREKSCENEREKELQIIDSVTSKRDARCVLVGFTASVCGYVAYSYWFRNSYHLVSILEF